MDKIKGMTAGRFLKALIVGKGDPIAAQGYVAGTRWVDKAQLLEEFDPVGFMTKAAVTSIGTGDFPMAPSGISFIDYAWPQAILGKLPLVHRVPFNTVGVDMTSPPVSYWVTERGNTPISRMSFDQGALLGVYILNALGVITDEFAKLASGDQIALRALSKATVLGLDTAFISAGSNNANTRPAGILAGAQTVAATTNPVADIRDLIDAFVAGGGNLETASFVLRPDEAAALNLKGGAFETLGALGGTLVGIPAITSNAVDIDSGGASSIVLLDQDRIQVTDIAAQLGVSKEATIAMNDVGGTPSASDVNVSMFQTNMWALRSQLAVNWSARDGAAVALTGAHYS